MWRCIAYFIITGFSQLILQRKTFSPMSLHFVFSLCRLRDMKVAYVVLLYLHGCGPNTLPLRYTTDVKDETHQACL